MNQVDNLQNGIDYIESNLMDEINYESLMNLESMNTSCIELLDSNRSSSVLA